MARISVIIPVYNHADELAVTLESLERQTFKDFEVIVVDDGSDVPVVIPAKAGIHGKTVDPSFRWDDRLDLIRFEKNRGAPAARNEGFRRASGEYVMFLDADAVLEPDALEVMRNILDTDQQVDFVYAPVRWGFMTIGGGSFDVERLKQANYIHTSALMRRSAFPGFDESLKKFQDWDLFLTMAEQGRRGAAVKRPLYSISERKTGMSRWVPKSFYVLPWHVIGWKPKTIRRHDEADALIRKKHGLPPDALRSFLTGVSELGFWAGVIMLLEILSALTVFDPIANSVAACAVGLLAFGLSLRVPSSGLALIALELVIGSKGRLLVYGADEVNNGGVPLRMILFAAFVLGWGVRALVERRWKDWRPLLRARYGYVVLAFVLASAFLNGWRLDNPFLFVDANAWVFLLLLVPALDIARRDSEAARQSILLAVFAALSWLVFETGVLFYIFSHDVGAWRDAVYLWVRRSGVGEITRLIEGYSTSRVFLQSHVYAVLGLVGLFAFAKDVRKGSVHLPRIGYAALASTAIISLSRSLWIGAVVGGLVAAVFLLRRKRLLASVKTAFVGCLAGFLVVMALMYFPFPSSRPISLVQLFTARADVSEAAALSRWQMLRPLFEKIRQSPLIGHGFGATVTYTSSDPRIVQKTGGTYTTYAFEWGWLDFWIKFGLVGIVAVLLILFDLGRRLARTGGPSAEAWIAVLAALAATHVFTPYLNHPLGLSVLILAEAWLVERERVTLSA